MTGDALSLPRYPAQLAVEPAARPLVGEVRVPGSKSVTNRALPLAALCCGTAPVALTGCLWSEDTAVMVDSLRRLGYAVAHEGDPESPTLTVSRPAGAALVPAPEAELYLANSGTSMRFLSALVALGEGHYRLDGVARMRERPIEDLLDGLRQMGVEARSEAGTGCPPVVVRARGLPGGRVSVKGDTSSQFLSALLLAAPFARADTTVAVEGPLVSRPYVDMTIRMLHQFRLRAAEPTPGTFVVPGRQAGDPVRVSPYAVEPDASAASYFFAAAALTGGRVTVPGLAMHGLQGDVCFVDVLERMGCAVTRTPDAITVEGGELRGLDVGMSDISDTVMTLAAVALFAAGPTTIRNVAHVRHKETDRLAALSAELRRLGAGVDEFADGLTITPGPLRGATVKTYDDHRMAMSLALVGLRQPGVVIDHPACVAKTYPHFFRDLQALCQGSRS